MKITKIIKLFTLAIVVFFGMFLNCHAEESNNITTLSQIVIDENIDNNFNVNLVFAEKYTENAFIQKLQNRQDYQIVTIFQMHMATEKFNIISTKQN